MWSSLIFIIDMLIDYIVPFIMKDMSCHWFYVILYCFTGWVGVSKKCPAESHGLPALSHVWQHVKLSDALSWGPSAI